MESAAKRKKMCRNDSAEGSAERVIGFWDKAVTAAAAVRLTCILIIHYNYAGQNKKDRSKDDSADCERIKKTFGTCQNTRVRDTSGRSDEVLDLIGSEEKMRKIFNLNGDQKPELFMVFIMTHGGSDGLLKTHHGDQFYVSNVLEQLHGNASLGDALKLLVVSACRGDIQEEVIYRREERPFNVEGVTFSSQLDTKNKQNLNATQIKSVPGMENIVILSSCVERTTSPRAGGSFFIKSFCSAFERLERNVDLGEFLTRVFNIHHVENKKWGYGSTPEYMVITQRRLTFSRQSFDGKGREEEEAGSYSWLSETPLLKRDAHVYLNSASSSTRETVNLIKEDLRKIFSFDVKNHRNLKQLQSSVGDQDGEKAGCIFMLIVTMLSRNVTTGELCVLMNGQMMPMKFVLNTMIGPTTANWIGKPKICVFLNTSADTESLAIDVSRDYPRTQYTVSGTIHSGLLTLILPQNDAPDLFLETLKDFAATNKIESGTFQQFFHEMLQKASIANGIPPMIVCTLPKSLEMKFPKPIVTESFRMTTPKGIFNVSLTDLERLVSMAGAIKIRPNAQAEETIAIDAASKGVVPKGANPMTQIEEPSNREVEVMTVESEENEAEEQAPEYNVFLVVAEDGAGKSHLAAHLAKFAQNRRLVTLLDDPDWSKGFKALHEEYLDNQPFDTNQVFFLDAFDALHGELLEKVLRMVQDLAENMVDLWIFTRPEGEARLRGLFPVTVIEINDLSMESKKTFLKQSGFNDAKIEQVLRKIEMEDAGDLISIVGNLEKVSSFPELADPESVNIYELCTHIFQEAVDSYMEKRYASFAKTKRKNIVDEIEKKHSKRASIYFKQDQDINANETCSGYDVIHVADTMAAYLFVKNGGVESVDQIDEMKIEPGKKSCLKRMIVSKKVFDQELCSY